MTLAPARKVTSVAPAAGGWKVSFSPAAPGEKGAPQAGGITARAVVMAAGGGSELARGLGLSTVAEGPVLCALACKPENNGLELSLVDGRRAQDTPGGLGVTCVSPDPLVFASQPGLCD